MEADCCLEFTGIELATGMDLVALVEKVVTGSVEKAMMSLHDVMLEHELCAG